jgi:hypothetical protein
MAGGFAGKYKINDILYNAEGNLLLAVFEDIYGTKKKQTSIKLD